MKTISIIAAVAVYFYLMWLLYKCIVRWDKEAKAPQPKKKSLGISDEAAHREALNHENIRKFIEQNGSIGLKK